jgi:ribosomal RNA-processing protein 12
MKAKRNIVKLNSYRITVNYSMRRDLFLVLLLSLNRVESQLVRTLLDGDESDPVSDLVLLQVLLSQVLQVLTREFGGGDNSNNVTGLLNDNVVTQVTDNTLNFDLVVQELDVRSWVKDTVLSWSGNVDSVLVSGLSLLVGLLNELVSLLLLWRHKSIKFSKATWDKWGFSWFYKKMARHLKTNELRTSFYAMHSGTYDWSHFCCMCCGFEKKEI